MGLNNFRLNLFTFMIDGLKMVFSYLAVARPTYYYIIIIMRTTLDGFIVDNAKGSTTSAEKHFVIKKILFMFRKKFATTGNRRKYC